MYSLKSSLIENASHSSTYTFNSA